MSVHASGWRMPCFRPGVTVVITEAGADVTYREQGCRLGWEPPASDDAHKLLTGLGKGGVPFENLVTGSPGLADVPALIADLDRLGLLTETRPRHVASGTSGLTFYGDLTRFVDNAKRRVCHSIFYEALVAEHASRQQLVGYAIEYYHVVNLCPRLLLPLISGSVESAGRRAVERFVIPELAHNKFLAASLASVGIDAATIEDCQPLPSTFALCATLGVWATQDPLSVKACLFIVETPQPEFNRALVRRCEAVGLAREFYGPLVEHSAVNDDEHHADISLQLLRDIAFVSTEEQIRIKKNAIGLLETLANMESEILEYYGSAGHLAPRVF